LPKFQPLIVGAGVAGLALAVVWRQPHGYKPLLCERLEGQAQPRLEATLAFWRAGSA